MRAAIYCRISQDATGENLGVTRQLEDCTSLIKTLGWTLTEIYTDNDISATSGKPRPEYRRMLGAIKAREVDVVVAWHSDRLYRKLRDLEGLIEVCEEAGVSIRTVRAGEFDLSTPTGRMMARILASVSAGEGEIKADRWKRSVRQRREAGTVHNMGPRLYGYDREGNVIAAEREHLEWAAGQILDGAAMVRTVINLNARGARTSLGNEWSRASLRKTLSNHRLAGMSVLNGDVVGVGKWPPIFDAETFEAIQAALTVRQGTVPARPRVALLLGIVKCGKCGKSLRSARQYRGKGNKRTGQRVYRCDSLPGKEPGCGGITIAAEPVEEIVEAYARARADDPRVRAYISELSARSGENAAEAVSLEARIRELEDQLGEPGVPVPAILRAIDRSKVRLAELRATAIDPSPHVASGVEWPADLARRARAVRNVVAEVVIKPAERGWVFDPERVEIRGR